MAVFCWFKLDFITTFWNKQMVKVDLIHFCVFVQKQNLYRNQKNFLWAKRKEEYSRIFSKALESGHTLNCAKEENKIRLNEWIYRTFVCDVTFYLHYRRAKLVVEEHLVVMHRRELSLKMVFFFPMNWGMTTNIVAKIYCPLLARAHTAAREVLVTSEKKNAVE